MRGVSTSASRPRCTTAPLLGSSSEGLLSPMPGRMEAIPLDGLKMPATGNEDHILTRVRESSASIAAYSSRSEDRDPHRSSFFDRLPARKLGTFMLRCASYVGRRFLGGGCETELWKKKKYFLQAFSADLPRQSHYAVQSPAIRFSAGLVVGLLKHFHDAISSTGRFPTQPCPHRLACRW
jgi:hypothetical protein